MKRLLKYTENHVVFKRVELVITAVLLLSCLVLCGVGIWNIASAGSMAYTAEGVDTFTRDAENEEYSVDEFTVCRVLYTNQDGICLYIDYPAEEWEALPQEHQVEATVYRFENGNRVALSEGAKESDIRLAYRNLAADNANALFGAALAIGLLAVSLGVITFFAQKFSTYEKIWFISIMALAALFAILMPEESTNGVSGIWIMLLYLLDTFLNILCELLISKQSKWNFIVSVFVEIAEILICVVLMYRFSTMLVTLLFWLPIDILSFINWHKHPDKEEEDITVVRHLTGWQRILVIAGVAVWTVVVGYLLSGLNIQTDLFGGNELTETVVCYVDACASALGIVNGLFIFFRIREQWAAWLLVAVFEAVINILSGQVILLVLKLGYMSNCVYGYLKWNKYIKIHENADKGFF